MAKNKKASRKESEQGSTNLSMEAYKGIRRMLFLNEIGPGQKLHYRDLAERLGMSPTPVIQALKWLEFQELVRHEPNRGFYMEPISIEEVRELFVLREALEIALLPELFKNLNDKGIKRLRSAHEAYLKAGREKYLKQRLLKDIEFHMTLAFLARGRITQRILRYLFDVLYLKYKSELIFSRPMEDVDREHQEIFDRVAARDLEGARKALSRHLLKIREHVIDGISRSIEESETLDI